MNTLKVPNLVFNQEGPEYIYCVCLSVRPSVRPKPKFGRLKTKFDDDAGSAKRPRKTKFGPTFYVFC